MTETGAQASEVGRVVAIWRYPVKSMMGEELNASDVAGPGLLGDRACALLDVETGKVASAKNPRRWPNLFDFRAAFVEPPSPGKPLPPVRITLPNGETVTTHQADVQQRLSDAVGRAVQLSGSAPGGAASEGYWPDEKWLGEPDAVFEFPLPAGTFFDCAAVHIMTTATLDRLRALCPASRFEVPRFRPNLVVETIDQSDGFVENDWVGRTLAISQVQLRIDEPCPRCVMTTLSQGSLPKDVEVLRTVVQGNGGNVGVYASVMRTGLIRRGDVVQLS